MAVKTYRPYTASRRGMTSPSFEEITTDRPERSLLEPLKKHGGRNNRGRVTVRHRGGGHKRMYRIVDFKRDRTDAPATVRTIEYDPNRSARIALIEYPDGEKRYILAPDGLRVGTQVTGGEQAEVQPGNALPLRAIPYGTMIHNIELVHGKGGALVRSAGTAARIMAKEGDHALVRLPSGEMRLIALDCWATVGQVSNPEHGTINFGKAGRSRWVGRRPHTRGLAMNPHDHPHGGGEGKSGQGNPHPVTPWGKPTKGYKTRRRVKYSDRWIVKDRRQKV